MTELQAAQLLTDVNVIRSVVTMIMIILLVFAVFK